MKRYIGATAAVLTAIVVAACGGDGQAETRQPDATPAAVLGASDVATVNRGEIPDSQYIAWLGQVQYVRRLNADDWQLVLRGTVQLSNDPLLPLEQFSVGGIDTVRGYRENELVRDNGWATSAEVRIPLWRKADRSILDVAPFVDAGYGWNDLGGASSELISSAGVGLIFNPTENISASNFGSCVVPMSVAAFTMYGV